MLQQKSEKEKHEETNRATVMNNPVSETINMRLLFLSREFDPRKGLWEIQGNNERIKN